MQPPYTLPSKNIFFATQAKIVNTSNTSVINANVEKKSITNDAAKNTINAIIKKDINLPKIPITYTSIS